MSTASHHLFLQCTGTTTRATSVHASKVVERARGSPSAPPPIVPHAQGSTTNITEPAAASACAGAPLIGMQSTVRSHQQQLGRQLAAAPGVPLRLRHACGTHVARGRQRSKSLEGGDASRQRLVGIASVAALALVGAAEGVAPPLRAERERMRASRGHLNGAWAGGELGLGWRLVWRHASWVGTRKGEDKRGRPHRKAAGRRVHGRRGQRRGGEGGVPARAGATQRPRRGTACGARASRRGPAARDGSSPSSKARPPLARVSASRPLRPCQPARH